MKDLLHHDIKVFVNLCLLFVFVPVCFSVCFQFVVCVRACVRCVCVCACLWLRLCVSLLGRAYLFVWFIFACLLVAV